MMPSITEQCPPKIYIGTKRRFQQGPVCCYELARVGSCPRLIYVCRSPPEITIVAFFPFFLDSSLLVFL